MESEFIQIIITLTVFMATTLIAMYFGIKHGIDNACKRIR